MCDALAHAIGDLPCDENCAGFSVIRPGTNTIICLIQEVAPEVLAKELDQCDQLVLKYPHLLFCSLVACKEDSEFEDG